MRILTRGAVALASVMFVVSCSGLLKKKGGEQDAAPEAAAAEVVVDAAAAPAPAALATNEGDIMRFPDETKLADVAATTKGAFNARESPPAGAVIGSVPKGTNVTQIAKRGQFFLITWDNPAAAGTKLMGWIHEAAFMATPPKDAGPPTCATAGEIPLAGDTAFCGKVCQTDGDCPGGQACRGQANKLLPNGKAGDGVTVCTVYHAPTSDAGPPRRVIVFAKDAAAPTPPAPAGDQVAPTGGQCPADFVLVAETGLCHRTCVGAGLTCKGANARCIKCDKNKGVKSVCATSRDQCK